MKQLFIFIILSLLIYFEPYYISFNKSPINANEIKLDSRTTDEVRHIDVTEYMSVDDFNKIKDFILKKGKLYTHGNLYGDLPFYIFSKY